MEGCGLAAGDAFLQTELTAIMRSPAWRTQRSLAIITFDEDAQDYQHPAQRVPTIILASQGVRRGCTDSTRYTHYSLLRTIEAALCLGTLTANDRYAQAVNSIFLSRTRSCSHPCPHPAVRQAAGPAATDRAGTRQAGARGGAAPAGRLGRELRLGHRHSGEPGHPQGRRRGAGGRRLAGGHRHPRDRLRGQ